MILGIITILASNLYIFACTDLSQFSENNFLAKLKKDNYDEQEHPVLPGDFYLSWYCYMTFFITVAFSFLGKPLILKTQMEVGYMGNINSKDMTFEMHATLRHWWNDSRLEFNSSLGTRVVGMKSLRNAVWTPTLFFINEKESELVSTTKDNIFIQILSNGSVYYAVRLRLILSCPMNLKNYPFDRQKCRIKVMSWHHGAHRLVLKWKKDCVIFLESVELPEHFLEKDNVECSRFNRSYPSAGIFSGVQATLSFRREMPYYLMEVYLPVSLLVIVSWLSFWLDVYAVPARTALGITTILTVITNSSGVKESIPRVSYVKAVDVWIQLCTFLVFCAFLEFPFVNFIARKGQTASPKPTKSKLPKNILTKSPVQSLFKIVRPPSATNKVNSTEPSQPIRQTSNADSNDEDDSKLDIYHLLPTPSEHLARAIDRVSRFLFPFVFVVFNLIYWFKWLA